MSAGKDVLVVRRRLAVPRERVFAAWLDPDSLSRWMCAGQVTRVRAEVDPRVGGKFLIVMTHSGRDDEHRGEYLAIEPPSLLSFTWISAGTDHQPTLVTVELREQSGGTELTLTHRRLPPAQVEPHRRGWTDIVQQLAVELA